MSDLIFQGPEKETGNHIKVQTPKGLLVGSYKERTWSLIETFQSTFEILEKDPVDRGSK